MILLQLVLFVARPAATAEMTGAPPGLSGRAPVAIPAVAIQNLAQDYLNKIRGRLLFLAQSAPQVPHELALAARRLSDAAAQAGGVGVLAFILVFLIVGSGAEALFLRAMRSRRRKISEARLETVRERVEIVTMRLGYALLALLMFAAGSLGAFLVVDWPPLVGALLLDYLAAVVLVRLAATFSRFVLAPDDERVRLLPMNAQAARFWHRSIVALAAITAFGWATTALVERLGVSDAARVLTKHSFGALLVAVAIGVTWGWRRFPPAQARASTTGGARSHWAALVPVAATVLFPLIGLLFLVGAAWLAWLLIVAAGLPSAIIVARHAILTLLRPVGHELEDTGALRIHAVLVERAVRALLVIVAALVLARAWELDLAALSASDSAATRLLRGVPRGIVIFLVADLLWQLIKLAIDRKLNSASEPSADATVGEEEISKRARIRTLLPILRNVLLIVLIATAVLMALSAMGVEIGPLLAGAGVVGVAVGFGAQTLVKDIIAGIFFLLDDAFRVGEYIISGPIKGTVESFSLRSVKLRHHRGPLHTVPFGDMKEITNYSRDWVIDKFQIGVTYDTDLDELKKVVKQVSAEIMADPELAAVIIEPLKSQGVYQMGDFAIQVRLKVKTKPNEQFAIRRTAYTLLKKAFDRNGIKFATPTVAVATDTRAAPAAAAQQMLEMAGPKPTHDKHYDASGVSDAAERQG